MESKQSVYMGVDHQLGDHQAGVPIMGVAKRVRYAVAAKNEET